MPLAIDFDPYAFACDYELLGIPHFWNVVTNLPFLLVGVWGLVRLGRRGRLGDRAMADWTGLWIASVFLAFASAAYHVWLTPASLGFDRVGVVGIAAFVGARALVLATGLAPSLGRSLAILALCLASVVHWWFTRSIVAYALVQGAGGLAVLALLLVARRRGRLTVSIGPFLGFLGAYAAAKGLEALDEPFCHATGHAIGGHPFKHLFAALGLVFLLRTMAEDPSARAGPAAP